MKRKNRLKIEVDCCFICGKPLKTLEDKLGHRINPKKGNSPNNMIIVCKECKKLLQKISIAYFIFSNTNLCRYFKKLSTYYKKLILNKIKSMRL